MNWCFPPFWLFPFSFPPSRPSSIRVTQVGGDLNAAQEASGPRSRLIKPSLAFGPAAILPPRARNCPMVTWSLPFAVLKSPAHDRGAPNSQAVQASASRRSFFLCSVAFLFPSAHQPCTARALRSSFPAKLFSGLSILSHFLFPSRTNRRSLPTSARHTSSLVLLFLLSFSFYPSSKIPPLSTPSIPSFCLPDADESTASLSRSCNPLFASVFLLASCHASWDFRGSPRPRSCLIVDGSDVTVSRGRASSMLPDSCDSAARPPSLFRPACLPLVWCGKFQPPASPPFHSLENFFQAVLVWHGPGQESSLPFVPILCSLARYPCLCEQPLRPLPPSFFYLPSQ
ncbi:hypothetical protein MAPG_06847 [Magnaporthiopsis poae ATCC 64411]|uniref:Uncharacterized protein n=1 Tax=Magnaporthiopsis poae (strain ATCC 64411 / 73-15) TaxID=644358 RepID=A0A0C4E355_MAGP6|nr:hypothetical protein MAPG_06847 [Magnaporthiopsis poae ATCC 64411]